MRKCIFITQVTDGGRVMEGMGVKQGSIMTIWIPAAQEEHRGPCKKCDARWKDTGGRTGQVTGSEGLGGIKTQLLTSFAAALLDPFGVRDVVVTSFAVVKCSKTGNSECLLGSNIRFSYRWRVLLVPLYFFGVTGDKEPQRPLLHFDVVPRVDEDAGYSETDTACKLTPARQAARANNSLIKRNGTHSWKVLHQGLFFLF